MRETRRGQLHSRLGLITGGLLVLALLVGEWAVMPVGARPAAQVGSAPPPDHVVVVMEENHGFSAILGSGVALHSDVVSTLTR